MRVIQNTIPEGNLHTEATSATIKRWYDVVEISGTAVLETARFAPGVPQWGQPHPVYATLLAKFHDVQPIRDDRGNYMPDAARVCVTFEGTLGGAGVETFIEFGNSTAQVNTDTGTDGKPIKVPWSGAAGDLKQGQRAEVNKYVEQDIITFRRRYIVKSQKPDLTYPTPIESLKEKYNGRVNSVAWRGGKIHEWRFKVSGSSQDKGHSYEVTITAERRKDPDSWDEWAWFRWPGTGQVPNKADKVKEDGVKRIKNLYFECDPTQIFDDLNNL